MLLFLFFGILILTGIYGYVGWRLLKPAQIPAPWKIVSWSVLVFLAILAPTPILLRSFQIENSLSDILTWPAYFGMGLVLFLFTLLILRDAVLFVFKLARRLINAVSQTQTDSTIKKSHHQERRQFLENSVNIGFLGMTGILTGYGFVEAKRTPTVIYIDVPIAHLPQELNGFSIVQITDIHVSPTIKRGWVSMIVEEVNKLNGDLIVLTGDCVDGSVRHLQNDVTPLADLHAPYGNFFVTGNHEYYSGAEEWVNKINRLGFRVLLNEHTVIPYNNTSILLAGVTDFNGDQYIPSHKSDPHQALSGAPVCDVKILLAHQPKSIYAAADAGYDLQISGHTHGGQFYPWNFAVRLAQPYISGLHLHNKTWIYVSRGTGYWGPPIRVGAPSEITVLTLRSQSGNLPL